MIPYAKQLLLDLLSRDSALIKSASCDIIDKSQEEELLRQLVLYKDVIKKKTSGIEMGGLLAPNRRFLEKALDILNFYAKGNGCSCQLFGETDYPNKRSEQGYITLLKESQLPYGPYHVACNRCETRYKVEILEYHFNYCHWEKLGIQGFETVDEKVSQ